MDQPTRTKIVCTMGPSTESDEVLADMIRAGMRVARFNFSHGDHAYHLAGIKRVRRIAQSLGVEVAVMGDTKGPEIRTRENEGHRTIFVESGSHVSVTARDVASKPGCIALDYANLAAKVQVGSTIFIDDGLVQLTVDEVADDQVLCTVMNGGEVGEHKGVNIPGVDLGMPPVTERDEADIAFACKAGMDALAVSFVCDESSPIRVRELCEQYGREKMFIISKIESALAVENFDAILDASDAIMVARGDLGVEIPPAEVPHTQKEIIASCNRTFTPVITATQMLDSMTHNPRPTRAEVTDVANAIYDGADCVMLSGETAAGAYPVESVRMMAEVCRQTEQHLIERTDYHERAGMSVISSATGYAAVELAARVKAVAILCPSVSGRTARIMSALRPPLPILMTTPHNTTLRRACFFWGVEGLHTREQEGLSRTFHDALKVCRNSGHITSNDIVVITAGDPVTSPFEGSTIDIATNVCVVAQAL